MSTNGSTNTSGQTPQQEVLERVAENFPTWQFHRMLGLVHLSKMMAAARSRVNDSHKLQIRKLAETLGYDDDETVPEEQDEGMFSVAGDTTHNHYHKARGLGTLAATILGSGGVGAAAMLAWQLWHKAPDFTDKPDPPAVVQPAVGLNPGGLKIEVVEGPTQ